MRENGEEMVTSTTTVADSGVDDTIPDPKPNPKLMALVPPRTQRDVVGCTSNHTQFTSNHY